MDDEDSTPISIEPSSLAGISTDKLKSKAGRKKADRFAEQASDISSAKQRGAPSNNNNAPLSREERKNEQIIRMIERQEKLRMRRENKKAGLPVSTLSLTL